MIAELHFEVGNTHKGGSGRVKGKGKGKGEQQEQGEQGKAR